PARDPDLCLGTDGLVLHSHAAEVNQSRAALFDTIKITPRPGGLCLHSAILALEDGTVFEGRSFGAPAERSGEVVFNTAITGYQEIFTDPSYTGQIVILTNPQIGNYGTSSEDNESVKPYIEGLAVREFSAISSNWRSDKNAEQFLA